MEMKGRKIPTIAELYKALDQDFHKHIEATIESNDAASCLLRLLKVPSSSILRPLVEILLSKYDSQHNFFDFNGHHLNITLEDVLFLTGLPIWGKPVITSSSRDVLAFRRVFGLDRPPKTISMVKLKSIATDLSKDYRQRVIAVLLTIISCMIIPSNDGQRVRTVYVQFVENLEEVDSYAWGAALLAYLYHGIRAWKANVKNSIDGNRWVLLGFFLIRIPKLRHAIGVELELVNLRAPLVVPVVEMVIPISNNRRPRYPREVPDIIESLTNEDIVWYPYVSLMLPDPLQQQVPFGTLLAPLFCLNYVVHHTPHVVAKQFRVFERYDVARFDWVGHHIIHKCNRGSRVQDFECYYSKELHLWNNGQLAEELMQPIIEPTTLSQHPPSSALCQYALDNKLKAGDVCTFELTSTDPMRFKVQLLRGHFPSEEDEDNGTSYNPIVVE